MTDPEEALGRPDDARETGAVDGRRGDPDIGAATGADGRHGVGMVEESGCVRDALGGQRIGGGAERGIGVYAHVPYCSSRCGYCDFNTYVPGEVGRGNPGGWASAAVAEVRLQAPVGRGGKTAGGVSTVFIGGGTPTLLPVEDLRRVLTAIDDEAGLAPGAEITVEANPETVTADLVSGLLAAGVNRLSIGMQSSDPTVLQGLQRQHTAGQAVAAAELACGQGFDRVSLDLIYGAPGENLDSWSESLDAAISSGVDHVSAYALKLEPNTRLAKQVARGEVVTPSDDYAAAAYEVADAQLSAAGLRWYEISNWALPGSECQHNLGYWRSGDWWGIGPGAHGHWRGRRHWNEKNPQIWQDSLASGQVPEVGYEELTPAQRLMEKVMLEVRLREGLSLESVGLDRGHSKIEQLLRAGLVSEEGLPQQMALTTKGRLLADMVTLRLLEILEK
jgi:putative oxygen-independent coproporphyrinogen III oxidase